MLEVKHTHGHKRLVDDTTGW